MNFNDMRVTARKIAESCKDENGKLKQRQR